MAESQSPETLLDELLTRSSIIHQKEIMMEMIENAYKEFEDLKKKEEDRLDFQERKHLLDMQEGLLKMIQKMMEKYSQIGKK